MGDTQWDDKNNWAVGGGLMMGLGVGFFLLEKSPLYFTGCIMGGIGLGLMVSAILSAVKSR